MPRDATNNSETSGSRAARLALPALIAGAIAIAFSGIFARWSELGPVATAFHRVALAVPVLWIWAAIEGKSQPNPATMSTSVADRAGLTLAGLLFAGDLLFWHWSLQFTSVANATLLANFAPIFVTLAAWTLFGERFSAAFLGAMALALGGAMLLMANSLTLGLDHVVGDALALVTAMFYGGYIVAVARLRSRVSTARLMAWTAMITALCLAPIAVALGESLLPRTLGGWAVLMALAWFTHAAGQGLITHALAHLPPAFSSVALLTQPAAAAVLAWVLLAEPLGALQLIGGGVILAGIVIARRASRLPGAES